MMENNEIKPPFDEMMDLIRKYPIKPMNIQWRPQDQWETST
jgi:hypothetical protein